jgi:hypothetical protein
MKNIYWQGFTIAVLVLSFSCKKNTIKLEPLASFNVVNVIVGGKVLKINSLERDSITYPNSKIISLQANGSRLYLYPSGDSLKPFYDKSLSLINGSIYSMFFSGIYPVVDTLIIKDIIPSHTDSSMGVRFINLSPNSKAVNLTLIKSPEISEFNGVSYQMITEYKNYPALSSNASYAFQIRDAIKNELLLSYTLISPRFKNVTLVLRGIVGGTGAKVLGITRVNNY